MLVAELDSASLAKVRLAASPTLEAICWLRVTRDRARHPLFGDPGPRARWALRDKNVALVAQLLPTPGITYEPDLLTPKPPPGGERFALQAQLDRIEQTDPEEIDTQVAHMRFADQPMPKPVRQAMDDGSFPVRVAAGLRTFWGCALADEWPHLRRSLDADFAHRAASLATHGVGVMLNSLHERVSWSGSRLEIESRWQGCVQFRDRELVLVPTVLGWPELLTQIEPGSDAMLAYPAFGLADGAGETDRESQRAFGRLMGATRSALLRKLDVPRSTTELSADLELATSTVSYHLGVLLRTGLVARHRQRRVVHYRRTSQGDALLDAEASGYY